MTWNSFTLNGQHSEKLRWIDLDSVEQFFLAIDTSCLQIGSIPNELNLHPGGTVRVALIESWFINIRLMIEFLALHGKRSPKSDFAAKSLGWEKSVSEDFEYWRQIHADASKWVAHLSKTRKLSKWQTTSSLDVTPRGLAEISIRILNQYGIFLDHLEGTSYKEIESRRYSLGNALNELDKIIA